MKQKTLKISIFSFIALMLFGIASCDIDKSINNSPNALNEESLKTPDNVKALGIALQVAATEFYNGDRSRIGAIWTRQMCAPPGFGRPQPVTWNSYGLQEDGPPDDMWKIGYRGVRLANDIYRYAPEVFPGDQAGVQNTLMGMAYAYQALIFAEMSAYFGSIPIDISGLDAAPFATQQQVYERVQMLLDSALGRFQNSGELVTDLNFGGDGVMWTKVIHSLKARYYLHMKNFAAALSESKMGVDDPSANLMSQFSNAAGEWSLWGYWTQTEVGEPLRADAGFIRMLKEESGDKRLGLFFQKNCSDYYGYAYFPQTPPDSVHEFSADSVSSLNQNSENVYGYGAYSNGLPFISYNENMFIMAEAAYKTGDNGTALSNLNLMREEAGLADYTGADVIGEVYKQKFLWLFLEAQSYNDMRRLGMLPSQNVPERFIYPISEKSANPNVPPDGNNLVQYLLP